MIQQDSEHPTGVSGGREEGGSATLVRARERKANAAVELIMSGATWSDVCEVVGYPTERTARVAVEQALEHRLLTTKDREKLRGLAGARLERLLRSVWGKAIDGDHPEHLAANAKATALIDRYCRLFGLDAPQEFVVHSPTIGEIEQWVARVHGQSDGAYDIVTGDIEETA